MKFFISIVAVLLTFLLILNFNKESVLSAAPPATNNLNQPNIVTRQSTDVPIAEKNQQQTRQKTISEIYKANWAAYFEGKNIKLKQPPDSYLEAYRDYVYFRDLCMDQVVSHIVNEINPVTQILGLGSSRQNDAAFESLSDIQKQRVSERIDQCAALIELSNVVFKNNDTMLLFVRSRMESQVPKTADELDIYNMLPLINKFEALHWHLNVQRRGFVENRILREDLELQINELYQQLRALRSREYTPDLALQEHRIIEQITNFEQQQLDNKVTEDKDIKRIAEELAKETQKLVDLLLKTESSDVFLALMELFSDPNYKTYFATSEVDVISRLGLRPIQYQDFLLPKFTQIKACSMGHPCGMTSVISEQLCLNYGDESAEFACNNDVINYIIDHQLSPSQLADLQQALEMWS